MQARLRTSLAMVSAALTVIVVAGWVRSLYATVLISCQYVHQTSAGLHVVLYQYGAAGGSNYIKRYETSFYGASMSSSSGGWQWSQLPSPGRRLFGGLRGGSLGRTLGFVASSWSSVSSAPRTGQGVSTATVVRFPHWFVLLLTLPILVLTLRRVIQDRHRARRRRMGLCEGCGYDLRGIAGACPECGRSRSDNSPTEQERIRTPYIGGNS